MLTFRSIPHLFMICQVGGYVGSYEDFVSLQMKDIKPYIEKASKSYFRISKRPSLLN